jgi:hypothetical protein
MELCRYWPGDGCMKGVMPCDEPERDPFLSTLRDGAIAVTGDPGFVDAVLAGEICPLCELGLPHDCKRNGLAE